MKGRVIPVSEDKCHRKFWWAIESHLSVARNDYELNGSVGLLRKVCNLTHNRFSHTYD